MRLCAVKEIEDNMILGKSIYDVNGKLLLGAGYHLTNYVKSRIIKKGYNHIYIMEEGTEDVIPQDIISDQIRLQANAEISTKVKKIEAAFNFKNISRTKMVDLLEKGYLKDLNITYRIRSLMEEILKDISDVGSKFLNTMMIKSKVSIGISGLYSTSFRDIFFIDTS